MLRGRPGYSNAALVGLLALLAVIAVLAQIQRGAIDVGALVAKPATRGQSQTRRGGSPPLIAPQPATVAVPDGAVPEAEAAIPAPDPRRELSQALGRMDGRAAAKLLAELDPAIAGELLSTLHERDLARILEEAAPDVAALWVDDLLAAGRQLESPGAQATPTPDESASGQSAGTPPAAGSNGAAADMEEGGAPPAAGNASRAPPDTNTA